MRYVKRFLLIFLINCAGAALAISANALFLFNSDYVLVLLTLIPVALIVLLQPWVPVIFAGVILTHVPDVTIPVILGLAFVSSAVTFVVYSTLLRIGWLDGIIRRVTWRRALFTLLAYAAFFIIVAAFRQYDLPPIRRGVPRPVLYLKEQLDIHANTSRYVEHRHFIDSDYLWRCELNEEYVRVLAGYWNANPVLASLVPPEFFHQKPYWWRVSPKNETRFWTTDEFPVEGRGRDGLHAIMSYEPGNHVLHAWIKDNF